MHRLMILFVMVIICLGSLVLLADNTPPEGFTALFNGKDLIDWEAKGSAKVQPIPGWQDHWKVEGGVIKYDGKCNSLWTKKSFVNFILLVDWRMPATNVDSGIYVRGSSKCQANIWNSPVGSGEVWGYRTDKTLSEEIRKAATPSKRADKPVGEWNSFVITVKGDRMTVVLNGETVINNLQMIGCPREGPVALQHHGQPVEFKNIYIKEIK
ncbi:MAG: DUF1080 domain-containing protein [Kiritimatiellae bacterium]|nr:DUF1080 domain-containing protein [Kiritimatiellia bacterium]MDD5520275.1 DUF1080 domain-containing protein [Kiritimatiellia bacterium]